MTSPAYGPLLDSLRGVRWPARRAVAGGLPGAHLSRRRGTAAEFSEYRPYRQGDDPRRLDWRLLARSDRAYVRIAEERSVLPTILVADATASMDYPSDTGAKWMRAREIVVALAAIAHASGDPVGLAVVSGDAVRRLPPRTRRGVVGEVARALGELTPRGSAPLAPLLAGLPRGARVVVVSDFLGDDVAALLLVARQRIAAGGEVHAVHVVDDAEMDPPGRAILATDPERAALRRPLTDESRAAYVAAFDEWRDGLARDWRAGGATYSLVRTGEPAGAAVRRLVAPVEVAAR
ncbi:MAG TPA: DUF58 domain-containing protein [Gemmatimonadaceae bacterium]|nr:DUF58 domain-containing protein [Gemmatimonadaceae bacterium]